MVATITAINNATAPKSNHSLQVKQEIYQAIETIFLIFVIYVFLSILFDFVKPFVDGIRCRKRLKKSKKCAKSIDDSNSVSYEETHSSTSSGVRREHKRIRQRANLIMTSLTLLMSSIVLIRVAVDLWAYRKRNNFSIRAQCIRHTVCGLLYLAAAFCLYVFLWIRQRAFYAHPVLKHLARPGIVRFSWSVLIVIITVMFFSTLLFFLPQFAPMKDKENFGKNETILKNVTAPRVDFTREGVVPIQCGFQRKTVFLGIHFTITVAFLYFQVSLQFLFGYPIFKQRRSRKRCANDRKITKIREESSDSHIAIHRTPAANSSRRSIPHFARLSSVPGKSSKDFYNDDVHEIPGNSQNEESFQLLQTNLGAAVQSFSSTPNLTSSSNGALNVPIHHRIGDADDNFERGVNNLLKVDSSGKNGVGRQESPAVVYDAKSAFYKISAAISGISFRDIKLISKSSSNVTERTRKNLQRRLKLRKYVIRCLCVSVICSISDIAAFLFIYFSQFQKDHSVSEVALSAVSESMLTSLAYNANIILNLLCMIACYKDWQNKLCPWYYIINNSCRRGTLSRRRA